MSALVQKQTFRSTLNAGATLRLPLKRPYCFCPGVVGIVGDTVVGVFL